MTVLTAVRPPRPRVSLWLSYEPHGHPAHPFVIRDGNMDDCTMTMRPTLGQALLWIFTFQKENRGTLVDRTSIRLARERSQHSLNVSERELTDVAPDARQPALALQSRHLRIAQ